MSWSALKLSTAYYGAEIRTYEQIFYLLYYEFTNAGLVRPMKQQVIGIHLKNFHSISLKDLKAVKAKKEEEKSSAPGGTRTHDLCSNLQTHKLHNHEIVSGKLGRFMSP